MYPLNLCGLGIPVRVYWQNQVFRESDVGFARMRTFCCRSMDLFRRNQI